jgi:hypothetical protein
VRRNNLFVSVNNVWVRQSNASQIKTLEVVHMFQNGAI